MRLFIITFLLLFPTLLQAQTPSTDLQTGDLIFQDLDCGPMCDAIEEVTQGYNGLHFSHVGLVSREGGRVYMIEAVGAGVRRLPLDSFLQRTSKPMYVGRINKQYASLAPGAVAFALQQFGKAYDDAFIYGNDKYYCSELIYDAFKHANHDQPFFTLEPMTFKQPGSDVYYPVWIDYYQALQQPIPEGAPGCNPGGLSRSDKLKILGILAR